MKHTKSNQSGFHLWYILIFIATIAVIGLVGWRVFSAKETKQKETVSTNEVDRNDPFIQQYGNNCSEQAKATFTHSPVAADQIGYIEPMGKMSDGHVTPTDHVYISPLNPNAADNSYNVVMPADGKIVDIQAMPSQYIGDRSDVKTAPADHRLVIAHNCRYFSIFIHVHQLSDKVKAEVGELTPNSSKQVAILMKAGEPIGKIGGSPVDWTLVDTETKLTGFITPDKYKREPWKVHAVDPLAVYSGTVGEELAAKSLRSKKPLGGKIDFDKPKALAGNWFKVGTNGYEGASMDRYWDGHLSVVPDYIDPESTIVSIGNWEGKAKQFAVKGKVDPTTITKQNSPVKYELLPLAYLTPDGADWNGRSGFVRGLAVSQRGKVVGTIMFEVQAGEKLKVETFPGKTSTQVNVMTPAAQTYER